MRGLLAASGAVSTGESGDGSMTAAGGMSLTSGRAVGCGAGAGGGGVSDDARAVTAGSAGVAASTAGSGGQSIFMPNRPPTRLNTAAPAASMCRFVGWTWAAGGKGFGAAAAGFGFGIRLGLST